MQGENITGLQKHNMGNIKPRKKAIMHLHSNRDAHPYETTYQQHSQQTIRRNNMPQCNHNCHQLYRLLINNSGFNKSMSTIIQHNNGLN